MIKVNRSGCVASHEGLDSNWGPQKKKQTKLLDDIGWTMLMTYSDIFCWNWVSGLPNLRSRPACKHFFYGFLSAKMGNKSHHFGVPSELNFLDPKNRRLDGFPRSFFLLMRSREISPWAAWAHRNEMQVILRTVSFGNSWPYTVSCSSKVLSAGFCLSCLRKLYGELGEIVPITLPL